MLVGIAGFKRCGKSSVTNILIRHYGFRQYGFADALRQAASAVNPIISLEGASANAWGVLRAPQASYNEIVEKLTYEVAKDEVPAFRRFLQQFGTDAIRTVFGANAWVDALARRIAADKPPRAVISDVRFHSEADWIWQMGGVVWRVIRPGYGGDDPHPSERDIPALKVSREITATNLQELEDGVHASITAEWGAVADALP